MWLRDTRGPVCEAAVRLEERVVRLEMSRPTGEEEAVLSDTVSVFHPRESRG